MAIQNVESTLPDREWVAAVEAELTELRGLVEQLRQDMVEARR